MSWEKRGKKRFYYRSVRVAGQTRKEYCGRGLEAVEAASADEQQRATRKRELAEVDGIQQTLAPLGSLMKELELASRLLMQGVLLTAGFHQHRGNWRKRREQVNETEARKFNATDDDQNREGH